MDRNVGETTDGQSCAVDGSCCGRVAPCTQEPSAMLERVTRWWALVAGFMPDAAQTFEEE